MRKLFSRLWLPLLLLISYGSFAAKLPAETIATDSATVEKPSLAEIKAATGEFNSLSRREKKMRFKEMKKAIKQYREDKKAGKDVDSNTILQVILALFIPPLAVYLHEGDTNNKFWISMLLTVLGLLVFGFAGIIFLGTLPSIIYALVVILGS